MTFVLSVKGYYNLIINNDMDQMKATLIKTLKAFMSFCEKYDLKYYAVSGTCLGAVRHKGIIPWDDDIDVGMPRKDYEKLLSLRDELKGTEYYIFNLGDKSPDYGIYTLPYAKFCDMETTIWERKSYPIVLGVYIDIFPYDNVEDKLLAKRLFGQYHACTSHYALSERQFTMKNLITGIKERNARDIISYFYNTLVRCHFRTHYFNKVLKVEDEIKQPNGDYYLCYSGNYSFDKELIPKSIFGEGLKVPFEDTEIVVPEHYVEYLEHMYGDWKTPPSLDKRVTHHYKYFQDLNKRWKIEDIKKLNLKEEDQMHYVYE